MNLGISAGSVSGIISKFTNNLGMHDANYIRKLARLLKKSGITYVEYSGSLRIHNICKNSGIDDNDIYNFIKDLFVECKNNGIHPKQLIEIVKDLKKFPEVSSITEIPKYISEKIKEKENLEMYNSCMQFEINKKKKEFENLKQNQINFEKEIEEYKQEFLLFKGSRNKLLKYGILIEDTEPLANVLDIFKNIYKYDPIQILSQFSSFEDYEFRLNNMKKEINELENRVKYLKIECSKYEEILELNQLKLTELEHLKKMGFDLPELKKLSNTIKELSIEYNIDEKNSRDLFFKYLGKFEDKIYFDIEIAESKNMLENLDEKISSKRKIITAHPSVTLLLQHLVRLGISEDQFLNMVYVFEKSFLNNRSLNNENIENIVIDIQKYGTINNSVKKLEDKRSELLFQVKTFENKYYQEFLSMFIINYIFINLLMKEYTQKLNTSYLIIHIPYNSKIKDTNNSDNIHKKEKNEDELNFSIHHDTELSDQAIIKYLK